MHDTLLRNVYAHYGTQRMEYPCNKTMTNCAAICMFLRLDNCAGGEIRGDFATEAQQIKDSCEKIRIKNDAIVKGMIHMCDEKCDWTPENNACRPCIWRNAPERPLDPETEQWILMWYFGHYGAMHALRPMKICQICRMLDRGETQVRAVIDTQLLAIR